MAASRRNFGSDVDMVTGVCPHDCPDTCSFQVAVDRTTGRALDLWGLDRHPVTRGVLCTKVDRYLDRTYHSDRLAHPLRRVGKKGEGRFEVVSWEEAITDIARRLTRIIHAHGAEAVLPYSYAGTMGLVQGEGMAARFFHRMGASQLARTICAEAGFEGISYTLGRGVGMDPESFADSDLIWIWGSNTLTSNLHLWPFIKEACDRGARLVVIDPVRTNTAKQADAWVGVRPGTDGALALGIMNVLFAQDLVDHDYLARRTLGAEQLRERVRAYEPSRVAEITGVPADTILSLARAYGRAKKPAIRINYGLQRHKGGGMAVRNITCLPALIGAWERGGGVLLSTSGFFPFDYTGLRRPDLLGKSRPRIINMNRLGDALSPAPERRARALHRPRPVDPRQTEEVSEVKALIVYNSNPAAVAPDQSAVRAGLRRDDLFTVVLEHFQTDTADFADYVLPATTQLEHWDLLKPYGHFYVGLNRPAIAPVGQSRPNSQIFRDLARALHYDDTCFRESDEEMIKDFIAVQQHNRTFRDVTWERLLEDGFARIDVARAPFKDAPFPTPSGKCELYSERMANDGYDPLPTYIAPASEQHRDGLPLTCISPPAHSFLNSSFVNVDRLRKRENEPVLLMHPVDALARHIATGDDACVFNELGEVTLRVRVSDDVVTGTVVAPGIWWSKFTRDGRNINQLVPQDEADMGSGALFYDVRVEVRRIEG